MRLWRPKRGPVLTWGRATHLLVGTAVPTLAWLAGGYEALGWACAGTLLAACVWEIATPITGRWFSWVHRWGDVVDLLAFALGVCAAGLILSG